MKSIKLWMNLSILFLTLNPIKMEEKSNLIEYEVEVKRDPGLFKSWKLFLACSS